MKKVSLTNRAGLPPIVAEVVESKGVVIGYSNDLGMEVNINCTDPTGQPMVRPRLIFAGKKHRQIKSFSLGVLCGEIRAEPAIHDRMVDQQVFPRP